MKGIDVVASIAITVCGVLIYAGHNGMIISLLATIIGYYFGRKTNAKTASEED